MKTTTIGKQFEFEAAHRLPNVPPGHKCANLHGHSYRVQVEISGPVDSFTGFVVDFSALSLAWKQLIHAELDHKYLNDVPGLENPTAEHLAAWIFARLSVYFDGLPGIAISSITVWETSTSFAVVRCG
jgi:6-pyruvoyltetrahydropterin/6-carboxytetrahydropterin synthase